MPIRTTQKNAHVLSAGVMAFPNPQLPSGPLLPTWGWPLPIYWLCFVVMMARFGKWTSILLLFILLYKTSSSPHFISRQRTRYNGHWRIRPHLCWFYENVISTRRQVFWLLEDNFASFHHDIAQHLMNGTGRTGRGDLGFKPRTNWQERPWPSASFRSVHSIRILRAFLVGPGSLDWMLTRSARSLPSKAGCVPPHAN